MILDNTLTVQRFVTDMLARYPLVQRLDLRFGRIDIRVWSNSPPLMKKLEAYYRGFPAKTKSAPHIHVTAVEATLPELLCPFIIKPPEPGKTRIKEEYLDLPDGRLVRKRTTGMLFAFGGEMNLAIGPCLANNNQVINFINNRFIQWELERGALLAHAAGVSSAERGLALAGFSGAGKSTLALHLMSRGLSFVSNDRLLLQPGHEMVGVPKLPRINPGTALHNPDLAQVIPDQQRDDFSELDEDEIWSLEHKYDVDIDACFGAGRFNLFSRLTALIILNWRRQGPPPMARQVELPQRLDLLSVVRKSPGLFFQGTGQSWDHGPQAYLDLLQPIPVYEITGGTDFDRAADLSLKIFESAWPRL